MQAPSCLSANTQLLTHHSKKIQKKKTKKQKKKKVCERERDYLEKKGIHHPALPFSFNFVSLIWV